MSYLALQVSMPSSASQQTMWPGKDIFLKSSLDSMFFDADVYSCFHSGHEGTIPFTFDPQSTDPSPFETLPLAKTVLITFPLKGRGQSKLMTDLYEQTHPQAEDDTSWMQLGSTLIYKNPGWSDFRSTYDNLDDRARAEDELLVLHGDRACILNLVGLYGGQRQLRHWLPRVAKSKANCAAKGAVHMIHGNDVARAIIGAHLSLNGESKTKQEYKDDTSTKTFLSVPETVGGLHWPVSDLHSYDWWDIFMQFGSYAREQAIAAAASGDSATINLLKGTKPEDLQYEKWVLELMAERGIRALPRDKKGDGIEKLIDGRAFWEVIGDAPVEGRADRR